MRREQLISEFVSRMTEKQHTRLMEAPEAWRDRLYDDIHQMHVDSLRQEQVEESYFTDTASGNYASQLQVRRKVAAGQPWAIEDIFVACDDGMPRFEVGYCWEGSSLLEDIAGDLDLEDDEVDSLHDWLENFLV